MNIPDIMSQISSLELNLLPSKIRQLSINHVSPLFIRIFARQNTTSPKMWSRQIILLFFLIFSLVGLAQVPELSPLSKISVLTSGPGDLLYSAFGHSAIRVQDRIQGIDVVYNYGIFNTSGENFYLKFAQGRMDYKVEREGFDYYLRGYEIQNRWVNEQELDLALKEKNELFRFLEKNIQPENKVYQYDYFLNNCATKIWDALKQNLGEELVFDETYIDEQFSFRQLIHHNIRPNSWGAFGIDLALGSVIDRKATPKEHMFLPIYIMHQLNYAKLDGKSIANEETVLYESFPEKEQNHFFTSPLFLCCLISLLILAVTYFDYKKKKTSKGLDFSIFFGTGAAGLIMCFLWFLTDHIWTVNNYNIVWAFPLNALFAFFVLRNSWAPWVKNYLLALLGLLTVMLIFWILNVQYFSPVLIPLVLALAVRYVYLYKFSRNSKVAAK